MYTARDPCEGPADLAITATDACSGANVQIRYLLFLDLDNDGDKTAISSTNLPPANTVYFGNANSPNFLGGTPREFDERPVPNNQKYRFSIETKTIGTKTAWLRWNTAAQPNAYLPPELPYGTHKIKWIIEDGCGNETVCEYAFIIKDCKPPNVLCLNGLTINTMPTGMITLFAGDFLQWGTRQLYPATQSCVLESVAPERAPASPSTAAVTRLPVSPSIATTSVRSPSNSGLWMQQAMQLIVRLM